VDLKVQRTLEMLDPFVGVTQKLMLSKHDSIVVLALKIFALLLPVHLPAMPRELPWVLKNIFFLLQRGGSTSSLTMQACFKTLTVLLREAKGKVMLSQSQLKVLLSLAKQDICESGRQAVAFGLVRAIIARKLVCEEVYDLVDRISEHMVTSQSEQTRALSAQTLIQFILEFPMGDKRLHAHLTSLVRNLDYGYESGRKIVLEVMARIAAKLPQPVMQQYLELFFLPLVTRLVNDDSSTCRKMVGLLIKDLLGRAERKQLDTLLDLVLEWSGGADALLRRAAAQVLGLLVEQQGSAAERYMERVLAALAQAVAISLQGDQPHGEWEGVYQLLTAAEKLHGACSKLTHAPTYLEHMVRPTPPACHARVLARGWRMCGWLIVRMLKGANGVQGRLLGARVVQHRHPWVQLAAARLLGRALGAVDPEAAGAAGLRKLLNACGGCFQVVRGICAQVAKGDLDERMSEQVLRNLVHLSTALHRNRKLVKDAEVDAASEEEEEEDGGEEDTLTVAHADGGDDTAQPATQSAAASEGAAAAGEGDGEVEVEMDLVEPVRAVRWLFQRLSHVARRHNSHRRSCVFQVSAILHRVPQAGPGLLTSVTAVPGAVILLVR
jgi:U3 small nucleolar RNA-associated protein 20